MTKRQVTKIVLDHKQPPYVPWSLVYQEAADKLIAHYNNSVTKSIQGGTGRFCWQSSFEVGKRYRFRGGAKLSADVFRWNGQIGYRQCRETSVI